MMVIKEHIIKLLKVFRYELLKKANCFSTQHPLLKFLSNDACPAALVEIFLILKCLFVNFLGLGEETSYAGISIQLEMCTASLPVGL